MFVPPRMPPMQGRVPELLDDLKQEFSTIAHDSHLYKNQKEEYERKLQNYLADLQNVQARLFELEKNHTQLKQQYEEEITRLRRQLYPDGSSEPRSESSTFSHPHPTFAAPDTKRPRTDAFPPPDTTRPSLNVGQHPSSGSSLPPLARPPNLDDKKKVESKESRSMFEPKAPQQQPQPIATPPPANKAATDWVVSPASNVGSKLTAELIHTMEHPSVVCSVKFNKQGTLLATGCNRAAQIFRVDKAEIYHTFRVKYDENDMYIRSVTFSPDSKLLAAGAEDKTVKLWNVDEKRLVGVLTGHEQEIYSVDYSHDGRFIVSGSGDTRAKIWDVEKLRCLSTLGSEETGPENDVTSVAISPDGCLIAAGSLDKVVRLWDARSGFIDKFVGHDDSVYSVAFAPDGKSLASGSLDTRLKLWDLSATRKSIPRLTFRGHKDFVLSVAFTPNGRWLVSGSKDRAVQFWDPNTGSAHMMLRGHNNSVISVATSPTLETFATGSGDSRARLWRYKHTAA